MVELMLEAHIWRSVATAGGDARAPGAGGTPAVRTAERPVVEELRQRCETIRDAAAWHAVSPGELWDWLSAAAARAGSLALAEPAEWASSLECLSWTLSLRLGEARAVLDEDGYAELVDGLLCGAEAAWEARRGRRVGE